MGARLRLRAAYDGVNGSLCEGPEACAGSSPRAGGRSPSAGRVVSGESENLGVMSVISG